MCWMIRNVQYYMYVVHLGSVGGARNVGQTVHSILYCTGKNVAENCPGAISISSNKNCGNGCQVKVQHFKDWSLTNIGPWPIAVMQYSMHAHAV